MFFELTQMDPAVPIAFNAVHVVSAKSQSRTARTEILTLIKAGDKPVRYVVNEPLDAVLKAMNGSVNVSGGLRPNPQFLLLTDEDEKPIVVNIEQIGVMSPKTGKPHTYIVTNVHADGKIVVYTVIDRYSDIVAKIKAACASR